MFVSQSSCPRKKRKIPYIGILGLSQIGHLKYYSPNTLCSRTVQSFIYREKTHSNPLVAADARTWTTSKMSKGQTCKQIPVVVLNSLQKYTVVAITTNLRVAKRVPNDNWFL